MKRKFFSHRSEHVCHLPFISVLSQNMERRLIATARHLTLRLKRGMSAASGTVSSVSGRVLPAALQTRLAQAVKYTEDLYQSFSQVNAILVPATGCSSLFRLSF